MKVKYFDRITNKRQLSDIFALLKLCDAEFIPPLSSRSSTFQSNLESSDAHTPVPTQYFEHIRVQSALIAEEGGHVVAFMAFKKNFVCEEIPPLFTPNIYITTVIVHHDFRNRGITNAFYRKLFSKFGNYNIFTRTWSTNHSHIRILSSLKFYEHCRKQDDRGPGIDTIYYHHVPAAPGRWQVIRQYHLTGNLLFLLMLVVFSVTFVLTWALTEKGMMHELSIAFATSLIASALCLLSDSMLKYRDSQNDEYINNLKNFGIENLQFHKDELLESIMPKCKHEIWITGYRLIMTGKKSFRQSLREACRRTHGLAVRVLVVPPWSKTFRLVYGSEDVIDNYIKIFTELCDCVEQYGTNLEIRFTDKPVFNDTYKVDDRFITSPYLHCFDNSNGKITAKDFFSLDINDPHKQLYDLIYQDYVAVWDESVEKLDVLRFMDKFGNGKYANLSSEEKNKLLEECTIPF